jgi:hypothetical protein
MASANQSRITAHPTLQAPRRSECFSYPVAGLERAYKLTCARLALQHTTCLSNDRNGHTTAHMF